MNKTKNPREVKKAIMAKEIVDLHGNIFKVIKGWEFYNKVPNLEGNYTWIFTRDRITDTQFILALNEELNIAVGYWYSNIYQLYDINLKRRGNIIMAKKVTIKDIADMAGVSIATVSHVINRTRYVSPDLVEKIENIIIETGYQKKIEEKERRLKVGRQSEIVAVIPNVESTIYRDMVGYLKKYVSIQGYQFYIAITDNDIKEKVSGVSGG